MIIKFTDDRDLGQFGKVAMGEIREDLPDDYAMLQVKYGVAEEVDEDGKVINREEGE